MSYLAARRLLTGLVVAGAVVTAAGAPAFAAPAAASADMYVGDSTIARGPAGLTLNPIVWADAPVDVQSPTLTYELTGDLRGVSVIAPDNDPNCENESDVKLVCTFPFDWQLSPEASTSPFAAELHAPLWDAKVGDTGEIKVTLAGDGIAPVTRTGKVRVAQNVDLATDDIYEVSAAPGESFEAPLNVYNDGLRAIDGVTALFFNDYAIAPTQRYSNCTYVDDMVRSCEFDAKLARGATLQTTLEYKLRADTYAPGYEAGELVLMTPDEAEDFRAYLAANGGTLGKAGSGDELTLEEQPSMLAKRLPQADPDYSNNYGVIDVTVTGQQGADLAAQGAELSGKAGQEVTLKVGAVNKGPASIDWNRSGEVIAVTDVTIPAGTTVLSAPAACELTGDHYSCKSGSLFVSNETLAYDFGLRIDTVIPDAKGSVAVNTPCECSIFADDLNMANNKAAIVLNPTVPSVPGTPGGSGDGGQGGGGGLPVTGPMGATIAGVGVLLLAAGVAGFVVARRRRTRFVA